MSTVRQISLILLALIAIVPLLRAAEPAATPSLADAIAALKQVGHEGSGNRAAARAWPQVAGVTAEQLPILLAALDDAGPLSANYLRAAIDTVAERALANGKTLPHDELERFVLNKTHAPPSRRLAFDWLTKIDPAAPDRLIPGFLDDPSLELRRDAVARLFKSGTDAVEKAGENSQQRAAAVATLQRAFAASRDLDQIEQLDKELTRLKQKVDLQRHFGFIASWRVIGPFDNRKGIGFEAVYPPEESVKFAGKFPGKKGNLSWLAHRTEERQGKVDLNQALGKDMGCVGYAAAEFFSPSEQDVDLRYGSSCATKLWLNGELKASHPVYHTGITVDQYVARGRLHSGRNLILVKVCQNEQTQNWAQDWDFQLRVCDSIGTPIHSAPDERSPHATQQTSR